MENLRRKEHDTSATVSEERSLAVRTKLRPPLLREDVVARRRLIYRLEQGELAERFWMVRAFDEA